MSVREQHRKYRITTLRDVGRRCDSRLPSGDHGSCVTNSRITNGLQSGRCCRTRREACLVLMTDVCSMASFGCCDRARHGVTCRIVMAHIPPVTTASSAGGELAYGAGSWPHLLPLTIPPSNYRSDQPQARSHCSLGVVFMCLRVAEADQDPIAHVLRYEATEALHGLARAPSSSSLGAAASIMARAALIAISEIVQLALSARSLATGCCLKLVSISVPELFRQSSTPPLCRFASACGSAFTRWWPFWRLGQTPMVVAAALGVIAYLKSWRELDQSSLSDWLRSDRSEGRREQAAAWPVHRDGRKRSGLLAGVPRRGLWLSPAICGLEKRN